MNKPADCRLPACAEGGTPWRQLCTAQSHISCLSWPGRHSSVGALGLHSAANAGLICWARIAITCRSTSHPGCCLTGEEQIAPTHRPPEAGVVVGPLCALVSNGAVFATESHRFGLFAPTVDLLGISAFHRAQDTYPTAVGSRASH